MFIKICFEATICSFPSTRRLLKAKNITIIPHNKNMFIFKICIPGISRLLPQAMATSQVPSSRERCNAPWPMRFFSPHISNTYLKPRTSEQTPIPWTILLMRNKLTSVAGGQSERPTQMLPAGAAPKLWGKS